MHFCALFFPCCKVFHRFFLHHLLGRHIREGTCPESAFTPPGAKMPVGSGGGWFPVVVVLQPGEAPATSLPLSAVPGTGGLQSAQNAVFSGRGFLPHSGWPRPRALLGLAEWTQCVSDMIALACTVLKRFFTMVQHVVLYLHFDLLLRYSSRWIVDYQILILDKWVFGVIFTRFFFNQLFFSDHPAAHTVHRRKVFGKNEPKVDSAPRHQAFF